MGLQTLSWHATAPRTADGEAGPLLCHALDGMTSRGHPGGRTARSREANLTGSGRDVLKYLPPRWPTECQVVCEAFPHLAESPSEREQYYVIKGDELNPTPVGHELGRVIFRYKPDENAHVFSKSCPERLEPSVAVDEAAVAADEPDSVLQFESRFESGNLQEAVHVSGNYYELRMRNDLYTARHTQWFYFRVTNTRAGELYRFSVTNFARCSTLYTSGQMPLLYSVAAAQRTGTGWRRVGTELAYYPCHVTRSGDNQETTELSYVLSFTLEFPYDNDIVFLASGLPYTFSALQDHLRQMQSDPFISSICHQRVLCRSLAGNPVFLLTITSPDTPITKSRRAVVLTARVHPAETQASWMMRGVLNFLTSRNRVAEVLRQRFVFKIVPMLNPDGVIVGNSRCSLAGRDMNRQFKHTHRDLYPAVWHLKLLVRRLMEEAGVTVYCDFHGHSRRQNAFIYGCENRRNSSRYLTEKVFPFLLDRMARNLFDFDSCQFTVHKSKEGTGRVVMWSMGITNAYTLEASSAGSSLRARAGTHYRAHDYELIGQRLCETLLDYVDTSPLKERVRERVMDTLKEQYGYTDPADGSESSSADDSDEAGSSSKTKKASKKWQSKKFQSLMSWKKRGKTPQTLTKITLRPPSENSVFPPPSPRSKQAKEAGSPVISLPSRGSQSPSLPPRSPVLGRPSLAPPPASSAGSPRRLASPGGRPGSARLVQSAASTAGRPTSPARLLAPPPARPRSLSLEPDSTHRFPSTSVSHLLASTQRLSLRLCAGEPRPLAAGRGLLPNSPLRCGQPAARPAVPTCRPDRGPRQEATAREVTARDATVRKVTTSDVTVSGVTSGEVAALKVPAVGDVRAKSCVTNEATSKKRKTKVKKGRKVKVKSKILK